MGCFLKISGDSMRGLFLLVSIIRTVIQQTSLSRRWDGNWVKERVQIEKSICENPLPYYIALDVPEEDHLLGERISNLSSIMCKRVWNIGLMDYNLITPIAGASLASETLTIYLMMIRFISHGLVYLNLHFCSIFIYFGLLFLKGETIF